MSPASASRVAIVQRAELDYSAPAAVAALVEQLARDLELDGLVRPGQCVLIKPNLVLDRHPRGGELAALVTHGTVIRAVLLQVLRALGGRGRVIIGDSPLQTTDFARAIEATGLRAVVEEARRTSAVDIRLLDFRKVVSQRDARGHIVAWREAAGDPAGYVEFDLAGDSTLAALGADSARFRVSNYEAADTQQYHQVASHRYVIARSVLDADVIVNVPKLKTHCKVGVTLGLKNFVGTVGRKQCLAHHREGGAGQGGDEYPGRSRLKRWSEQLERQIDGAPAGARREALKLAYRINERLIRTLGINPVRDGGWHGNDTCWRMVVDLNKCLFHFDGEGKPRTKPLRYLAVVDGIIGGEGNGPMAPDPKPCGVIVAGANPLAVDSVCCALMGFDWRKVRMLAGAFKVAGKPVAEFGYDDITVVSNEPVKQKRLSDFTKEDGFAFKPHFGWVGGVEME